MIAFIHESVGREGLRDLLHLNPISFATETEVLAKLPGLLKRWGDLKAGTDEQIRVQLETEDKNYEDGHRVRELFVTLVNDTHNAITTFDGRLRVPAAILTHWSTHYWGEEKSEDTRYRAFRFNAATRGTAAPHSTLPLYRMIYCLQCAFEQALKTPRSPGANVDNWKADVTVWIDGREYTTHKILSDQDGAS